MTPGVGGAARRILRVLFAAIFALAGASGLSDEAATPKTPAAAVREALRVFVGTYTGGESRGIYRFEIDAASGSVIAGPSLAGVSENPSFLALHPSGKFLYAVNEAGNFRGGKTGAVSAFAMDPSTGSLTFLNQQPSEGADPCHLAVDRAGRYVLVANYTGGSVALFLLASDGRIEPARSVHRLTGSGPNAARQQAPHAHGVFFDPEERFALIADLGADRILVDRFDGETGRLTPNEPDSVALEPGSGPRHLAWHPSGRFLYAVNELFSTVTAFRWHPRGGRADPFQTVPAVADGFSGDNKSAEIAAAPGGRFLYVSNRGDDALTVFAIDATGRLANAARIPTGGRTPRHFAIDPAGRWLIAANQDSGSVVVFRLDPETGLPRAVGAPVAVPQPVSILLSTAEGAGKKAPVP